MSSAVPTERLQSLDQFRGYTVAGMFLVNFLGGYEMCPQIWRHTHDYCSYADTIMPHFLFAAGFALRLSFLKHQQHGGGREAWLRMLRRAIGLSLVAIAWYSFDGWEGIWRSIQEQGWQTTLANCAKRNWMQTLLHIAITSVWIMPVLWAPISIRVAYAAASAAAHIALSYWFNFLWVNGVPGGVNGIDGGPLGFLTWSIVSIAGTWACDVCLAAKRAAAPGQPTDLGPAMLKMMIAGWLIAGLGWLFSCGTTIYNVQPDPNLSSEQSEALRNVKFAENPVIPSKEQLAAWKYQPAEPPFYPPPPISERKWNYWMMSQRAGTLSYLTFSAGFSLLVFTVFVWLADVKKIRVGVFRTLGVNALAGYMLADLASPIARKLVGAFGAPLSKQSPPLEVWTAFVLHFLIVYGVLRLMEWRKVYFRM
jgi:predicted acyltransferase